MNAIVKEESVEQERVDEKMAEILRKEAWSVGEILSKWIPHWDHASRAEYALAQAKARGTIVHALELDTPANLEAVGRAIMHLARISMGPEIREALGMTS